MKIIKYTYSISNDSLQYTKVDNSNGLSIKSFEKGLKEIDSIIKVYLEKIEEFAVENSNDYYANYVRKTDIKMDKYIEKIKNMEFDDSVLVKLDTKIEKIKNYFEFIESVENDLYERYDVLMEYIYQVPEVLDYFISKNMSERKNLEVEDKIEMKTEEFMIIKGNFIEDKIKNLSNTKDKVKIAS